MGKYAIVEGGVVVNVARADAPLGPDWFETQDAGPGWLYEDGVFSPPPEVLPSQEDLIAAVIRERDRRLAAGFDYDFADARGIHRINTTDADMRGWDEVTKLAQTALNLGQPDTEISIKTGTGRVSVTAGEWQMILLAAGQYRQPIFNAAFDLREMDPVPQDFADDGWWP
ncbi:DUF4376 domain-containing protein [Roseinatronobacter sp.]|uniref:DUF4376 domain-containing protein n=1 Tax=Roseinatronobacter sp. TaxID=1945755 RepID=UPI003F706FC0